MRLKQTILLAIIGVVLQIIAFILWMLMTNHTLDLDYYYSLNMIKYAQIISIIGNVLLLPFFITLFKRQK